MNPFPPHHFFQSWGLEGVCRELVQHVIEERKAQDNVSVVVLHMMPKVN